MNMPVSTLLLPFLPVGQKQGLQQQQQQQHQGRGYICGRELKNIAGNKISKEVRDVILVRLFSSLFPPLVIIKIKIKIKTIKNYPPPSTPPVRLLEHWFLDDPLSRKCYFIGRLRDFR